MNIEPTLLQACRKNDRKAQFQLYESCFSLLMSVCVRYKRDRNDAKAILNQGFLKILTNLDKYDEKIPFGAWIHRIMVNTIIDEYRKYKKENELTQYADFTVHNSFDNRVDFNLADQMFDAEEVEYFIKQLPPMTLQVFNLSEIDGYSHKEIAKMLNIAEGTSKWHLSNARKKLKALIAEAIEKEQIESQ